MNCQIGDLAIKIASVHPNEQIPVGAIVKVISKNKSKFARATEVIWVAPDDIWNVEWRGMTDSTNGGIWGCRDSCLRPIRDNDGEDESLKWAPVPVKEIA